MSRRTLVYIPRILGCICNRTSKNNFALSTCHVTYDSRQQAGLPECSLNHSDFHRIITNLSGSNASKNSDKFALCNSHVDSFQNWFHGFFLPREICVFYRKNLIQTQSYHGDNVLKKIVYLVTTTETGHIEELSGINLQFFCIQKIRQSFD